MVLELARFSPKAWNMQLKKDWSCRIIYLQHGFSWNDHPHLLYSRRWVSSGPSKRSTTPLKFLRSCRLAMMIENFTQKTNVLLMVQKSQGQPPSSDVQNPENPWDFTNYSLNWLRIPPDFWLPSTLENGCCLKSGSFPFQGGWSATDGPTDRWSSKHLKI